MTSFYSIAEKPIAGGDHQVLEPAGLAQATAVVAVKLNRTVQVPSMGGFADKDTVGTNDLTLYGPTSVPGSLGQALQFNDSESDYARIPAAAFPAWYDDNTSLSFSLRFRTSSNGPLLGNNGAGATPGGATPSGYVPALYVDSNGKLRGTLIWHGSMATCISLASVNDDVWHTATITYNHTTDTETMYLDGDQADQRTGVTQTNYNSGSYDYWLGTGYAASWPNWPTGGWDFFTGLIDDVRIYNRELTGAEASDLADGVNVSSGLVAYWPLDTGIVITLGTIQKLNYTTSITGIAEVVTLGTIQKLNRTSSMTGIGAALTLGTVQKLNRTISVVGLTEPTAIGSPSLKGGISVPAIAVPIAFGTLKVNRYVLPPAIGPPFALGTLKLNRTLTTTGFAEPTALGTPSRINRTIIASAVAEPTAVSDAFIQQDKFITPEAIVEVTAVGTGKINRNIAISGIIEIVVFGYQELDRSFTAVAIAQPVGLGTAQLNRNITPSSITVSDVFGTGIASPVQYVFPDSDDTLGGWLNELGGTNLHGSIDESDINDADYIKSSNLPVNDIAIIKFGNPSYECQMPLQVKYRYKKIAEGQMNLSVRLLEGTTEIAAWTHTDIGEGFVTAVQDINTTQFNNITDFNNLYVELKANYVG